MTPFGMGLGMPYVKGQYSFRNPEALAFVARRSTPPTNDRKKLYDDVFTGVKAIGISKFNALYLTAADYEQAAQLNLISTSFTLLPSATAPTFVADRHYVGNGTSSYLNTQFQPSVHGAGIFTLNSSHIMGWARNNLAADASLIAGGGGSSANIDPRRADNNFLSALNDVTNATAAVATSVGYSISIRMSVNTRSMRRNTAEIATSSATSTSLPSAAISLLARNGASNFSALQIAAASIGGSLTAGESDALYNTINTYLTAVGAA